jgi:hypothetical protein
LTPTSCMVNCPGPVIKGARFLCEQFSTWHSLLVAKTNKCMRSEPNTNIKSHEILSKECKYWNCVSANFDNYVVVSHPFTAQRCSLTTHRMTKFVLTQFQYLQLYKQLFLLKLRILPQASYNCKSQDFAGENSIILWVIPFPVALCSDRYHLRCVY